VRSAVALVALGPAAYRATVRKLFERNIRRVNAGDPGPLFSTYAPDVRFVFPGQNSWAGDYRGREAVEGFVNRFVDVGIQLEPSGIVVDGPPWSTRACLRYTARFTAPGGEQVYANRGVLFARMSWGRLKYYEVNEDTERVAEFDAWLAEREPPTA
jgi:hypothetical protein